MHAVSRTDEARRELDPGDAARTPPALRIALVVERFERDAGGVERVAWELARGLARAGDDVHVVAREAADLAGVFVHRVPVATRFQPLRLLEFSRAARRVVEAQRFDVVHGFARVHVQHLLHGGLGCHAAYMRAAYGPVGAAVRRLTPRHAVILQLERALAGDPRVGIQAISQRVRDEFVGAYGVAPGRFALVPNGIDLERFAAPPSRHECDGLRAALAPGAEAVWLLPGSGFRRKGVATAIEALARSRLPRAHLWVAGRDDPAPWQRRAARAGVKDRVHFLGPRHDVQRLLFACDGLLLPTRYDPGGLVVLEAAAAGRPVVTSAACGHAELLGDAARVVDPADDAGAFARALDGLADAGVRARLGQLGRERVQALDWPGVVARLRREYARIAEAARPAAVCDAPRAAHASRR